MSDNLLIALQITLVGMGLVFGMICALWIGMGLLVRLAADTAPDDEPAAENAADEPAAPVAAGDRAARRKAAVAAVAVALAQQAVEIPLVVIPAPPSSSVSGWQAVARSNQLRHRGRVRR